MSESCDRRSDDKNIAMLTMAVERLAENQNIMTTEIKELTRTISKLDVIMEKMVNMENRHNHEMDNIEGRLKQLESHSISGCPALREMKVSHEGKYDKVVLLLKDNREHTEKIQTVVNRIAWMIVSAVVVAILSLVIQQS